MEEMLEETLNMEEDEELEEEADTEVDKVLFDITDGKLGAAGTVKTDLPVSFMYNFRSYLDLHFAQDLQDKVDEEEERNLEQ